LTRSAAAELSHAGIRLNCISPGGIVTGIFAKTAGVSGADADRVLGVIRNRYASVQPIPRAGETDDVAQCSLRATRRHSSLVRTLPLTAAWCPSAITAGTIPSASERT
jgi:NAD(P)-dependent dehydrogenase (short-subunit alcohol dehydrogenase family)